MPWGRQKKSPNLVNIISPTFTKKRTAQWSGDGFLFLGCAFFL
nr:MAG TPA: hypothetical protein [Caudoviricetes sp.]